MKKLILLFLCLPTIAFSQSVIHSSVFTNKVSGPFQEGAHCQLSGGRCVNYTTESFQDFICPDGNHGVGGMDCPDDMVCCGAKVCCVLKHGHECFAIRADEDNSKCAYTTFGPCHGGCRACPFECDQNAQKTLDDFRDKLKAGHDIQEEQPTQESPSAPHREYFDWIIAVVFWLAILTPSCFIIFFTAKIILFSKRRNVFLEEMEVKSKNIIRLYASTNILVFMGIVYACIIVISIIGCWLSFQDMVNYVEREGVLNYPTVVVVLYFAMIFLMFDIFKTSYDTYKASRRE